MISLVAWKEPVTEQIERALIATWTAFADAGLRPNGNAVMECARRHGLVFRTAEAKAVLAALRPAPAAHASAGPGTAPAGPSGSQRVPRAGFAGPSGSERVREPEQRVPAHSGSRSRAAKDLSKRDTDDTSLRSVSPETTLRSVSGELLNARETKKRTLAVVSDLAWVAELRAAVDAFRHTKLADLDPEQRMLLGRYHCLRFANCTQSEPHNKRRGRTVALGFAKMASSVLFGEWTVEDYVKTALEYHVRIADRAPWFNPFEVRSVLETSQVPEQIKNVTPAGAPC